MGNQRKISGNEADGGQDRATCAAESLTLDAFQTKRDEFASLFQFQTRIVKNRDPVSVADSVIKLLERRVV